MTNAGSLSDFSKGSQFLVQTKIIAVSRDLTRLQNSTNRKKTREEITKSKTGELLFIQFTSIQES